MGITIKPQDRILIVAPHPDDESIGCGGIICLYHKQVDVLLVTDGYNPQLNNRETAGIRQKEFHKAMETAGVHECFLLHIPEHEIRHNRAQFKRVDVKSYDHIFVPNRYEQHQDHIAVYQTVKKLAGRNARLYEYEVWTTIRDPNIIVDIGSAVEEKRGLIACHASQVKELDYDALAIGLNAYRGRVHGREYAEAFFCQREKKEQAVRQFKRKIKGWFKRKKN